MNEALSCPGDKQEKWHIYADVYVIFKGPYTYEDPSIRNDF